MLYTGERNYGCRFMEITIMGLRAIILENEKIRTTFILDKGTDIIEFNYKKTDTDFVWRNPMGISCLRKMQGIHMDEDCMSDNYLGGWFEIMPNVGGPCSFKGKNFPGNSEVSYLPWEYCVICDTPEEVSLKCFVKTSKLPFLLEKTITVKSNIATLFFDEKLTNLGKTPMEFQWGHHPNIGGKFLDDTCVIDMPGGELTTVNESERINQGIVGSWPFVEGKKSRVDFSKMPSEGSLTNEIVNVDMSNGSWAVVRNESKGMGVGFSWDGNIFNNAAIWMNAGNSIGHHHHDGAYVLCILPKNTKEFELQNAFDKGELPALGGGESVSSWFNATAFESSGKVIDIEKSGKVMFDLKN